MTIRQYLWTVVTVALLAVGSVLALASYTPNAAADNTVQPLSIATPITWNTLKAEVEDTNGDAEIDLGGATLVAGEPITVDRAVTIKNGTVYRDATATSYVSMFKVGTGTLTLGDDLTLSGYVADPADPTTAKIRNWTDLGGYPRNEGYNKRALKDGLRGFFVEVEASGTLVIDGATIKQYTTEALWNQKDIIKDVKPDTPVGVSPIYVAGNFEMTSGTIEGNFASAIGKSNLVYQAKISGYGADQYVNDTVGLLPLAKGLSGASRMNNLGANIDKFSAGAVFLDGANANYKITGGEIKNNGGNTGAIIVNKGQLTIGGSASISDNYADYTAAIFISSDAGDVRMCSGDINNNFGGTGGGVLAANNGSFFLMGGTIDGNYSINNGGGILIYSNNVHLIKGNITNNASGTMGGGIYVYGNDNKSANQSYTTVITNAEITENTAVYTPGRAATSESEALGVYTADWKADNEISDTIYPRGAGGGVWLCPAGITSFDVSAADLYGNTAQYQGDDFLKDAGFDGGLLVDFGPHDQLKQWIHDEKTAREDASKATSFTVAEATSGTLEMFGLKNTGGAANGNSDGVVITGNASRRGGGIGSDGSVFLINGNEVDIDKGSLTYKKTFDETIPEEPMEFEMVLADADGKAMLDDNDEEIVVATFHLYDKYYAATYETQRKTLGSPVYGQEKATWKKAEGVTSTTEAANYSEISIEFPKGNEQANFFAESSDGSTAEFHIIMREYHVKDDGTRGARVSERMFSSTDPEFVDKIQEQVQTYTYYEGSVSCTDQACDDCSPDEAKELKVYNRTYNFKAAGENKPDTPEIEKYVDEAVHKNIALKDEFTYNILAYVTADADEMIVTDKLDDQLQFVSDASDVKVYDLGTETDDGGNETPLDSNHLPVYDVSGDAINNGKEKPSVQEGNPLTIKNNDYSKVEIDSATKTLTVKLANKLEKNANDEWVNSEDDQELTDLRGHYIRIEFKAKIKDEIVQAIDVDKTMSYKNLVMTKIEAGEEYKDGVNGNDDRGEPYKGNDPVKSSKDHVGIPNTASYTIKVKNTAGYQDSSNTVTVNPSGEIEKYINKDVDAHLVEFDRAFTYDILAQVPDDADKVVITDTLVKSLEFSKTGDGKGVASADPSKVVARVAVKNENNHFAKSKTDGGEIPTVTDDSVITKTLTLDTDYKATISGKKLTITIGGDGADAITDADDLRGKWIQVTFYAKYTDAAIQAAATNPPADNASITSDGAVISNIGEHDGTRNIASYTVTVDNKAKYSGSSNTVTHDAETTKLTVNKTWSEGSWPDEVKSVTFGLYAKKDGNETALQGTVASDGKYTYRSGGNATVVLNKDTQELEVTNLPKLIDTEYLARELKVNNKSVNNLLVKFKDFLDYLVSLITGGDVENGYTATINNEKIETEKYVNNDVHADLVEYDKVFKYDIITYVSKDATELTITDPLPGALEFAKKTSGNLNVAAEKADTADDTIEAIVAKVSNNHTAESAVESDGSTVKGTDGSNAGTTLTPDSKSIDNNTLTIKFGDGADLLPDPIRGKYVQVTFYAKYTQDVINGADAGDFTRVTDDGAVITKLPAHEGTANQAQVSMTVKNGATANLKTNTVTVPAITTNVWVQKKWQDAEGSDAEWPTDENGQPITIKVNVYKNEEGKDPVVVDTIELTSTDVVKSKDYPKLVGVTYSADEAEIPEGYLKAGAVSEKGTEDEPFVITNKAIGGPEIEKYVNQAVHKDIALDEEFPYDIIAFVTNDAETVTITDTLNEDLQFVSEESDVVVTSLDSDNHKVTNDVAAVQVNSDATVAEAGAAVNNAEVSIIDKTLTVKIADATSLRGKWVRVHFVAKIAEGKTAVDLKYTPISATVEEDRDEPNIGNAPVASDEDHTGVPNTASYVIGVINEADRLEDKYNDTSNTVTVKPKEHTIKISKTDLGGDEIEGATIKVTDAAGNVVKEWTSTTNAEELSLTEGVYTMEEVVAPKGYNKVTTKVEFSVDKNGKVTLLTTEVDGGGAISVDGTNHIILEDAPVTEPEIEKYVAQAVHKDISLDEEFTYDIMAFVTFDADTVTITDTLNDDLAFVSKAAAVKVTSHASDNHKPTNDVSATQVNKDATVAEAGSAVSGAKVAISGQTLTVSIAEATSLRGTWLRVRFVVKIADSKTATDLTYTTISASSEEKRDRPNVGNDPVVSNEDHTGVPNTASYVIGVKNSAGKVESKYNDKSNTVTVKPKEHAVKISKTDLGGDEIEGATIKVTDAAGNVVKEWTSTTNAEELSLTEGVYTMEEVVAPTGFNTVTTKIEFSIDKDGVVTLATTEVNGGGKISVKGNNHIILADAPIKTLSAEASTVTKTWEDGGNDRYRANVEFQLYRMVGDGDWEIVEGKKCTLTSENSSGLTTWTGRFENLPAYTAEGELISYRAVEANAAYFAGKYTPDSEEEIIVVTDNSTSGMGASNHPNTPNTAVSISKQKVGGGPELPGATLTIYKIGENGERSTIEDWTWKSDNEPHSFSLEPGVYVLQEVTAPDGYEVAEEMTFRVNVDGTVELYDTNAQEWMSVEDHIVMFDAPKKSGGGDDSKKQTSANNNKPVTPATGGTKTGDAAGSLSLALAAIAVVALATAAYSHARRKRE